MRMVWSLLLLAACGGGGAKTVAAAKPAQPPIDAFHDVLAPLWHAPDTPERTAKTCAQVTTLEARAQDVGDAPLVEAVHALGAACDGDRAQFQARFSEVHTAFHAAADRH